MSVASSNPIQSARFCFWSCGGRVLRYGLAVVAPGIAEALFATALGLLAAIPAVAAYNKFSNDLDKIANSLEYFSIEFLSKKLTELEEKFNV